LGLGDKVNRLTPTLIPNLNNIIQISAGGVSCLVLDKFGKVYSFGSNNVI
jgi:alpha-tubulin suppressor-like RCC1 family protein